MANPLFVSAGPLSWGSSRMRVFWVAEALGADVVLHSDLNRVTDEQFEPYTDVIFQKNGAPDLQERLQNRGKRVWWDACDPMWWFSPRECRAVVARTDGVVCSSPALADDLNRWLGRPYATVIPDRLKLVHFDQRRYHHAVSPISFIWYGVAVNRMALFGAWANLTRLAANGYAVNLVLFDDRPDAPWTLGQEIPVYHITWDLAQEVEVLTSHDIALLPPYPGPWGRVKSNNKELTAGACGLPVTDGFDYDELKALIEEPAMRQAEGERRRKDVELLYGIERSAQEWKDLLDG